MNYTNRNIFYSRIGILKSLKRCIFQLHIQINWLDYYLFTEFYALIDGQGWSVNAPWSNRNRALSLWFAVKVILFCLTTVFFLFYFFFHLFFVHVFCFHFCVDAFASSFFHHLDELRLLCFFCFICARWVFWCSSCHWGMEFFEGVYFRNKTSNTLRIIWKYSILIAVLAELNWLEHKSKSKKKKKWAMRTFRKYLEYAKKRNTHTWFK